jgi:arylsulfatase A-like enzyme
MRLANRVGGWRICGVILVILAATAPAWCGAAERPNILVILTDDQGYGDLTAYGAKDMRTPHMDEIVARGMRFDNFYANSPVCSPSRAAIMSGRYPDRVGMPGLTRTDPKDNWGYLAQDVALLPAVLHKAGYHTGIVGKWNLGLEPENSPNARGFDFFHGFLGDMMDSYLTHRRQGHNYMRLNEQEIDPQGHATDLFTQWSIEYLRQQAGPAKTGRPFFLYLAYNAPHLPTQPPAEWLERVKKREAGIDEKRAGYVALIEHLDDGIGKVMSALKDAGLEESTLVIFTSDNGGLVTQGANVGSYRGTKGTMYEGGLRVPMAAVWPGHIAAGSRSEVVSAHMDVFATACDAAGIDVPPGTDGLSLLSVLQGNASGFPQSRQVYFVRREGGAPFYGLASHALRLGDWKLLQNTPLSALELYNLKDDPMELHDLSGTEPKMRNQLAAQLQLQIQRAGAVGWQKPQGK